MVALLSSFAVVTLAEMGDKTQLVAFALATRYQRPWTVMLGILLATTLNHALAAAAGVWIATLLTPRTLGWVLGLSFLGFGLWTLRPDRPPEPGHRVRWGPLLSTAVVFFLAEMGDKTQLATAALGARFGAPVAVTAGTTLGMLAADGLAVLAATRVGHLPAARQLRWLAAALLLLFGAAALLRAIATP